MKSPKRYTITAALPYVNGPIHLGHIAGAYLPSDIYARYLRMNKEDVVFVCGSDEHGAAITLRAKKEGILPQEIIDKYDAIVRKAFIDFGMSFDIFHRTSSELHHKTAQDFFKVLLEKNKLTVQKSEQFYDQEHQQFLADRYITGECPKCHYDNAYGDQCEKCGSSLSPTELINPISTLSGKTPILKETSHWYLPMDQAQEWIEKWLKEGILHGEKVHEPSEWKKHVLGQCMSWVDGGLQPRAMTRDLDWGVKVPLENAEGKVLYVWLDAPIGYISATKQWALDNNKDWTPYWQDKETKLIHFIGKDNIVFHGIIFPILLENHGGFILPDNVPANEFLNLEGDKFSTSRNWAVWLHEYIAEFPDKVDEMRYVLGSILPETKDAEFTWADYQARINNELVAILGNFVNRVLVLTNKYYEGFIPKLGELHSQDKEMMQEFAETKEKIGKNIMTYRFRDALAEMMNLARIGNKYLADQEPWKLIKTEEERVKTIMNLSIQLCANLTIAMEPFMPTKSNQLREMLQMEKLDWSKLGQFDLIPENHKINSAQLLFQKIEDETVNTQIAKLAETTSNTSVNLPPQKEEITFDDFTKMDIRVGKILTAEKVKKANKLLQLTVDLGFETRTIISGIAESYNPEEVIGKKVSVLINLAPRKIRGVESQGMILMAENAQGELSFISPEKDSMNEGGEIR